MYYALTINSAQIISGVHESTVPIDINTFARNKELSDDAVVSVPYRADYQANTHILCYNEDGTRKPDLWCIENGYMDLPLNKEIINGELVDKEIPAEKQPQTLKEYMDAQFSSIRQETAPAQKAATVMFRALAQTDVITATDALDNAGMFPAWAERVGSDTKVGEYLRHDDSLYRVKQSHKVQVHYPPSTATAALYGKVTMPGEIPDWTTGSWAKDVKIKHNGKIWLSMVDNNTWEPGAAGVYQDIWKEVF